MSRHQTNCPAPSTDRSGSPAFGSADCVRQLFAAVLDAGLDTWTSRSGWRPSTLTRPDRDFLARFGDRPATSLTAADLRAYRADLEGRRRLLVEVAGPDGGRPVTRKPVRLHSDLLTLAPAGDANAPPAGPSRWTHVARWCGGERPARVVADLRPLFSRATIDRELRRVRRIYCRAATAGLLPAEAVKQLGP